MTHFPETTTIPILDAIADGISIIDSNGAHVFVNRRLCDMIGWDASELVGVGPPHPYWAPGQMTEIEEALKLTLSGSPEPFELKFIRRDGSIFPALVHPSELQGPEGQRLFLATVKDISRLKQNELEIGRLQKSEFLARLTAGVAHDFNNILAVIMGNLELLEDMSDPRGAHDLVREAIASTIRGAELTNSLMSAARKATLNPEVLNMDMLVTETQNWVRRTIPANIHFRHVGHDNLWSINVDKTSMENALVNLIINASDAMPKGGTITVEARNVALNDQTVPSNLDLAPGKYVLLEVTDTGTGIEPELQERIFEPFFTTKEESLGSGLGLSTIQGFVKQSGGAIGVRSDMSVGTTFTLFFPACVDDMSASNPSAREHASGSENRLRVLLAEDEKHVRDILLKQLERAGHDVVATENGDSAAEVFASDSAFDVLVTDVVMPGKLQGPDLIQKIREMRPDIPAILLSGYPSDAIKNADELRQQDITLMKPVRRNDLLRALEDATQQET